jgi:hypothetical protein
MPAARVIASSIIAPVMPTSGYFAASSSPFFAVSTVSPVSTRETTREMSSERSALEAGRAAGPWN